MATNSNQNNPDFKDSTESEQETNQFLESNYPETETPDLTPGDEKKLKPKPDWYDKPPQNGVAKFFWSVRKFTYDHKRAIRTIFLLIFLLVLISGISASAWLLQKYNSITDIEQKATRINEGSIVYDKNDQEFFRFYDTSQKREVVPADRIPEVMQGAIIALEDENFYNNPVGIPWWNMAGASSKCLLTRGNNCRGGSGLSQQLIKNVTGNDAPSVTRKVDELLTAIKFNQEIGDTDVEKEQAVLQLYLNWVPFGRNTYGAQAATRSYFNHDIDSEELTIPKACYLASMVQRPSTYAEAIRIEIVNRQTEVAEEKLPNPNWEVLETRKNICIDKMFEENIKNRGTERFILTPQERDELKEVVVEFQPNNQEELTSYGHIRTFLIQELETKLKISETDLATKGYRVYTTFDRKIQDEAQAIVTGSVEKRIQPNGGNNAAAVILDGPSGGITAMVGSVDFNNKEIGGQVNVTTAARQPGSSFKPYVYASAFGQGFNPGTVLLDVPMDFGGYTPQNFSRTTRGLTNIRGALADSLNIPAVEAAYLSQQNGLSPNATTATKGIVDFAKQAGVEFPFEETCTVSTALGGCEVTMLSHANGINTLLQDGNFRAANPFRSVLDQEGVDKLTEQRILSNPYPQEDQRIDPAVARQIADVMSDYGARSPGVWGQGRSLLQLQGWDGANQVAAKTGTTNDVKDTWTVGGTPYYTITVWVGNTDGRPMNRRATSTGTAAPIWQDLMKLTHTNLTPKGFSEEGLQQVTLDPQTGLIAGQGSVEKLTARQVKILQDAQAELNKPEYDPTKNSIFKNRTPVVSRTLKISKLDGKLIPNETENYPAEFLEERACKTLISFFPSAANWFQPAQGLLAGLGEQFAPCPSEFSTIDPNETKLEIQADLEDGETFDGNLTVQVNSLIPEFTAARVTIKIGEFEKVFEGSTPSYRIRPADLKDLDTGTYEIIITATDNTGKEVVLTIKDVEYKPKASSSSSSSKSSSSSSSGNSSSSSSSSSSAGQSSSNSSN